LSATCKQAEADAFENLHSDARPSRSSLALLHYPSQSSGIKGAGHNKHTDLGTLTFLLCEQWGLQILTRENGQDKWRYVVPRSDAAIINVGDTLHYLSGKRFKSAVHRVIPMNTASGAPDGTDEDSPERRQNVERNSIAYFLRAVDEVELMIGKGRRMSAKEYHDTKFDVFRSSHSEQDRDDWLTGGMERGGTLTY